jgi:hypothetical protein
MTDGSVIKRSFSGKYPKTIVHMNTDAIVIEYARERGMDDGIKRVTVYLL